MAQYQVPQFIEIEDKIFGPLTLKQFIYLAGGAGIMLVFFSLLPLWLMVILSIPVAAFSIALAFYQVNGRPFIHVLENAFTYTLGTKLYLWMQRESKNQGTTMPVAEKPSALAVPKLSQSRLRDLSWSLNIKDRSQEETTQAQGNFAI